MRRPQPSFVDCRCRAQVSSIWGNPDRVYPLDRGSTAFLCGPFFCRTSGNPTKVATEPLGRGVGLPLVPVVPRRIVAVKAAGLPGSRPACRFL
jgi:hypothetical protein